MVSAIRSIVGFMRAPLCASIFASVLIAFAAEAQTPSTADQLLSKAKTKAAAEKKNLFIIFGASW